MPSAKVAQGMRRSDPYSSDDLESSDEWNTSAVRALRLQWGLGDWEKWGGLCPFFGLVGRSDEHAWANTLPLPVSNNLISCFLFFPINLAVSKF